MRKLLATSLTCLISLVLSSQVDIANAMFDNFEYHAAIKYFKLADTLKDNDRENTINKMRMALTELVIEGIKTNQPLHLKILDDDGFKNVDYYIKYLEEELIK